MLISRKRSKIDIIKDALETTRRTTTKTSLILGLHLGWRNGEKIVKLLVEKNLIQEVSVPFNYKTTRYIITQKGVIFLENYKKIRKTLDYVVMEDEHQVKA